MNVCDGMDRPYARGPGDHRQGAATALRETTDQPERCGLASARACASAPTCGRAAPRRRRPWRARWARARRRTVRSNSSACALTSAAVCSSARPGLLERLGLLAHRRAALLEQVEDRVGRRRGAGRPPRAGAAARARAAPGEARLALHRRSSCEGSAACRTRASASPPAARGGGRASAADHPTTRARRTRTRPAPPHGWQRPGSSLGSVSGHETEERDHATEDRHRLRRHTGCRRRPRARRGCWPSIEARICWSRACCRTRRRPRRRSARCRPGSTRRCTRRARRPPSYWATGRSSCGRCSACRSRTGINALAADQGAELIVFGSPHHGRDRPRPARQRRRGGLRRARRAPSPSRRPAIAGAPR